MDNKTKQKILTLVYRYGRLYHEAADTYAMRMGDTSRANLEASAVFKEIEQLLDGTPEQTRQT